MDKNLKADIQEYFRKEYIEAAFDKMPGRLGRFMRWGRGNDKPQTLRSKILNIGGGILGAAVLGGALAAGLFGAIPLFLGAGIFMGGMILVNGPIIVGQIKAEGMAKKALNKDIDSGTLVDRYATEVLGKQAEAVQQLATDLSEKSKTLSGKSAKPDFTTVIDTKAPVAAIPVARLQAQPKLR